jgi:phosphate transport system ATP-binding protein
MTNIDPSGTVTEQQRDPTEPAGTDQSVVAQAQQLSTATPAQQPAGDGRAISVKDLHAYYDDNHAIRGVSIEYAANQVTAMIGPSGCGKSTVLRCLNRMHEEIPGARAEGSVTLDGVDIYDTKVDVVSVRRAIGMVF